MPSARRNIVPIKRDDVSDLFNPTVIIPAAEINYQTKIWGAKSLIPIRGKYLVEHQIDTILSIYPKADIILVVGPSSTRIINYLYKKYKVRFILNKDYESKNVIYSLSLGLQASIRQNVMIIYGDLFFNKEALDIVKRKSMVLVDSKGQIREDEVGIVKGNNLITNFGYGWDIKWGEIIYLTNNELSLFIYYTLQKENENLFCYEVFNKIIGDGGQFHFIEPSNSKIKKIVHPKDLENI